MTSSLDLLIVEDKPHEAAAAIASATALGYKNYAVAGTLSEARLLLPRATRLASDLFFPLGDEAADAYIAQFVPAHDAYAQRYAASQPVRIAVSMVANAFNLSHEQYMEQFMPMFSDTRAVQSAIENAMVDGVILAKSQSIVEKMRAGQELPLGIALTSEAKARGIPSVIVTSTYHHDIAFEPVRQLLEVPYVDVVSNGSKQWTRGLELLAR